VKEPAGVNIHDERCREDLVRLERTRNDSTLVVRDGPMERRVEFAPGHDHRSFDCGHGVNGMTIRFILVGPAGAVQWVLNAPNWVPDNVWHGQVGVIHDVSLVPVVVPRPLGDGNAWDLGYHAPAEQYEGQTVMECDLLPSGYCFYDGSGLNAEPILVAFLLHGPMAVWAALSRYYGEILGN
jgi:hypothetical protein